jgi:hypothetical protein
MRRNVELDDGRVLGVCLCVMIMMVSRVRSFR